MVTRYFDLEEYRTRQRQTLEEMERRGCAAAVVFGKGGGGHERHGDLLYLANYYSTASGQEPDNALLNARAYSALVLRRDGEPELHADIPGKRDELLAIDRFSASYDPIRAVARSLRESPPEGPVALVGSDFLPMKYWTQLEAETKAVQWRIEDDLVQAVRRIKSPAELAMYREGGEIASRAVTRYLEGLIGGSRECDAAAEAAATVIREAGGYLMLPSSHGHYTGFWCSNPLYGYSQEAPEPGDIVRAWVLGPIYQGYYFDPGRTAVAGGRPDAAQKELIEGCASIVERVIAEIRPGRKVMEVARMGERMTRELGGGNDQTSEQWPLYGHSLGLFWEDPYIATQMCTEDDTFEVDMVFGVEAFLGREGVGGAGFEQNLILTADGPEIITKAPMIWW